MARYTKAEQINDLLKAVNELRQRQGKVKVKRGWTGVGHWLMTDEENHRAIGRIFVGDDLFIGFLEGMLITE